MEAPLVEQDQDTVVPGRLVEFRKDARAALGLVLHPDGKKNWMILDAG